MQDVTNKLCSLLPAVDTKQRYVTKQFTVAIENVTTQTLTKEKAFTNTATGDSILLPISEIIKKTNEVLKERAKKICLQVMFLNFDTTKGFKTSK